MKLPAKEVHLQVMTVLLADEVHKLNKNHNVKWLHNVCRTLFKRAETRNFKVLIKITKFIDGWMEALADEVYTKHIPQHC